MREDCKKFNYCSAPLCPLDEESLRDGLWYPDEEICTTQPYPNWIKTQRKIARRCKDKDKYFTYEMLDRNCVMGKGMVGLDPDRDEKPQLKRWLRIHPPKRKLSEEEKEELRKMGVEARKKLAFYREKLKKKE